MTSLIALKQISDPTLSTLSDEKLRELSKRVQIKSRIAIKVIQNELVSNDSGVLLAFSGGKDSSALLKLSWQALASLPKQKRHPLLIVYCDTGVEIPVVASKVRSTLIKLRAEAHDSNLPITIRTLTPRLTERYFVKVLGRGYPTPTNKFRWCTDRLRINPLRRVLGDCVDSGASVLLGTRLDESSTRSNTMKKHSAGTPHRYHQSGNAEYQILAPIDQFTTRDVWATVLTPGPPYSLDGKKLALLYEQAGGECPILKGPESPPCGAGRFGCWTCTVVRRDRAVTEMIENGYSKLEPLLQWRNWIAVQRDLSDNRSRFRRNGQAGPGPLTMAFRQRAYRRLRSVESRSGYKLLHKDESKEIFRLWRQDRKANLWWE